MRTRSLEIEPFILATLDVFKEENKLLASLWAELDGKAKNTVTVSGVFIAVSFAFVREARIVSGLNNIFLSIVVLLLLCSVGTSIYAMRITKHKLGLTGNFTLNLMNDIISYSKSYELKDRYYRFLNDQINRLYKSNKDLYQKLDDKANWILVSQKCLIVAMIFIALICYNILIF